jgi:hypothetical protein
VKELNPHGSKLAEFGLTESDAVDGNCQKEIDTQIVFPCAFHNTNTYLTINH